MFSAKTTKLHFHLAKGNIGCRSYADATRTPQYFNYDLRIQKQIFLEKPNLFKFSEAKILYVGTKLPWQTVMPCALK